MLMKKALVLGADGYLGFAVSLDLALKGWEVHAVDNLSKRFIEAKVGVEPLIPIGPFLNRFVSWNNKHDHLVPIQPHIFDIAKQSRALYNLVDEVKPDVVIHFAEQPSAPYSMKGRSEAIDTQINNISGTLNLAFAVKAYSPNTHIIKLGTMGEYGTPNIDIEEGWLNVSHNGREDRVMFPKKASSFYHLSKVHDSNNLEFTSRNWGLRVTDLNQGIVYGVNSNQTESREYPTSFHYDSIFGTVINRFITQGLSGHPLTVYGGGNQTRAYLHISDVIQCINLAIANPAEEGEFKVRNQFTEHKSVNELAEIVASALASKSIKSEILHIQNPRIEQAEHYYNPVNTSFIDLGLKPKLISEKVILELIDFIQPYIDRIDETVMLPNISWKAS
tara:strand:- start:191 stop:1360 length:1170 start_codon:yes stop_codon:yes gene_type:complete